MLTIDAFFAGVGGIELGFTETKHFKVNYANEFDKYAIQTYKYNFKNPESELYNDDLIVDNQDIHSVIDVPDCDIMSSFSTKVVNFSLRILRNGKDITCFLHKK